MVEGIELHHSNFHGLFDDIRLAKQALRDYAEPFARQVLGDLFVDNLSGWRGWDVTPVYSDRVLVALDFVRILYNDRGPDERKAIRVSFPLFDKATYNL